MTRRFLSRRLPTVSFPVLKKILRWLEYKFKVFENSLGYCSVFVVENFKALHPTQFYLSQPLNTCFWDFMVNILRQRCKKLE